MYDREWRYYEKKNYTEYVDTEKKKSYLYVYVAG